MDTEKPEMDLLEKQDYFIKVVDGLRESRRKGTVNGEQIKHNVEWFLPVIECFEDNIAFCKFLKTFYAEESINQITEETKNSKHAIFIREYLTSFASTNHEGRVIAPNYNKLIRFYNFTTYKHNYLFGLCFARFEKHKVSTIRRNVKTSGIVALSMKSKAKQKLVRDAIRVDDDGWSDYRVDDRPFEFAWSDIRNIKDTVVSKFIKDNAKRLRLNLKNVWFGNKPLPMKASDSEMNGEYGFLKSYSFKYGMDTLENRLSEFRGSQEVRREIARISKRIAKVGNQTVVNMLSQMLPDWSELDEDSRKTVLTFVNKTIREAKMWKPLKDGSASQQLKQEFIKKVESYILAQ